MTKLCVPSQYTQMIFTDTKNSQTPTKINAIHIDIWFAIMYLVKKEFNINYRINKLNDDEFNAIYQRGFSFRTSELIDLLKQPKKNAEENEYTIIRSHNITKAMTKLSELHITTNALNKGEKRTESYKAIDAISTKVRGVVWVRIDQNVLRDFLQCKKVMSFIDLDVLFALNKYSKLLYLLANDYSNLANGKKVELLQLCAVLNSCSNFAKGYSLQSSSFLHNTWNKAKEEIEKTKLLTIKGELTESYEMIEDDLKKVVRIVIRSKSTAVKESVINDVTANQKSSLSDEALNGDKIDAMIDADAEDILKRAVARGNIKDPSAYKASTKKKLKEEQWNEYAAKIGIEDTLNSIRNELSSDYTNPLITFKTTDEDSKGCPNVYYYLKNDFKLYNAYGDVHTTTAKESLEKIKELRRHIKLENDAERFTEYSISYLH